MKSDDVNRLIEQAQCKTDPDAPHGFDSNASHSADRYVCECEGWETDVDNSAHKAENVQGNVDGVNISQDRVDETAKGEHEPLYMDMSQVPTGMPDWKPGMVFPAPKKEWVGLTDDDYEELLETTDWGGSLIKAVEAKLKEKNLKNTLEPQSSVKESFHKEWTGLDQEMMRNTPIEFNRGALWAERYLKEKNA